MLNPNFLSDLLSDHSRNTSFMYYLFVVVVLDIMIYLAAAISV